MGVLKRFKGARGERKVNRRLNSHKVKVAHREINGLILLDDKGRSHQIDHVEIRHNGIFCIETKNLDGWIFGSENQEKWTICLGKEKYQIYNPLKQNKVHIYHLSKALDNKYKINSLVVMAKNNSENIKCSNVIDVKRMIDYLERYNDGTYYTLEEMEEIYNKITRLHANITEKEHRHNVKSIRKGIDRGICPRCGGELVTRKGPYGKFKGCSNYPKCKFVLKDK